MLKAPCSVDLRGYFPLPELAQGGQLPFASRLPGAFHIERLPCKVLRLRLDTGIGKTTSMARLRSG
jgi:hypothetical protein